MTTRRTSANIYDYPEHLNPFYEEDNHSRLRFWATPKKKSRSNSFSFQSIKDFRGSLRLPRSRKRTGTSNSLSQLNCYGTKPVNETQSDSSQSQNNFFSTLRKLSRSFSIRNKNKSSSNSIDKTSQIENDEVQLRVPPPNRQIESYSESQHLPVTPLPRSRIHERVRHSENPESERSTERVESRLSVPSGEKNPFGEGDSEENCVILRAHSPSKQPITPSRKKNRAPAPPVRKSSLKTETLTHYRTSTQTANKSIVLTVVPKETETVSTDNGDIKIKVEKVMSADEERNGIVEIEKKNTETSTNEEAKTDQSDDTKSDIETFQDKLTEDNEKKTEAVENTSPVKDKSAENTEKTSNVETVPVPGAANINCNSEMSTTNSRSSITTLEQLKEGDVIEDASDLLELVTKLKMEVDKMTDDTNNNIIQTEEEKKARNIESWTKLESPNRKNELNLNKNDDDDDVICSAPMSPRFVRLRKDNDWIRREN